MGFKSEMIEARDEFIALVKAELLGPGSEVSVPDAEHELITTVPEKRYSIGILFPKDNKMKADGNDVDLPFRKRIQKAKSRRKASHPIILTISK